MPFVRPLPLILVLTCTLLGACASGNSANGVTGAASQQPQATRQAAADDAEPTAPVPPDPYKSVQYRGGRDPVSGNAPGLDGEMPTPPTPPKRAANRAQAAQAKTVAAAPAAAPGSTVEVKPGDTLFAIATRHKVSVASLMQANNLSSPKIVPGQRLTLP